MPNNISDQSTSVNISSNTLFHFTNSIDNLLNILQNDFSPHYCLEIFNNTELAYPMVSFCDLPLFLIRKHLELYGSYGIGLSKSWGMRNSISPILYVHDNSLLSKIKFESILYSPDYVKLKVLSKEALIYRQQLYWSFLKNYKGRTYRNGKYIDDVRFYDEREWRFVPDSSVFIGGRFVLEKEEYLDENKRSDANSKLAEKFKLEFTPNDIQYIIVNRESEILQMIRDIERIKGNRYTADDVKILTTKIISYERISEDF
jgi:hypothetical protein